MFSGTARVAPNHQPIHRSDIMGPAQLLLGTVTIAQRGWCYYPIYEIDSRSTETRCHCAVHTTSRIGGSCVRPYERIDLHADGSHHPQRRFQEFPQWSLQLVFAGLGFLSLYLAGKLHLFDRRGNAPKAWISLAPLSGAALVAISRTMDYRHHWHDVTVGSILGFIAAYFAYRQYYPSLADDLSHRPYSPRIRDETSESILPVHDQPKNPRYDPVGRGNDSFEMDGTVPRPGPQHLRDVWRDDDDHDSGAGEHNRHGSGANR